VSDQNKIYYTPSSGKGKKLPQSTSLLSGKETEAPSQETEIPEEGGTATGQQVSIAQRVADRLSAEKNLIKETLSEKVERIASRRGSRPPQTSTISQPSPPDTQSRRYQKSSDGPLVRMIFWMKRRSPVVLANRQ
jgi:hypothetical protein